MERLKTMTPEDRAAFKQALITCEQDGIIDDDAADLDMTAKRLVRMRDGFGVMESAVAAEATR